MLPLQIRPASLGSDLSLECAILHPENRTVKQTFSSLTSACVFLHSFCRSSPRLISIGQLHASRHFHLRPINDIVYVEPYSIKDERSYLRGSFTLRCFQRLSRPDVATQLCPWQDNWCTRGLSIPVLSYYCLLYTSPSPRDKRQSRMPSSA